MFHDEKADLKSRSDSTSVPPLDSIYTTPTGFHHHHHHHPHHHAAHHPHQNGTPGSPEAMKTPNSETDCGTVKESLTDDASSTAGTSPLQDGGEGGQPASTPSGQPEQGVACGATTTTTSASAVEEVGGRCVREDSSSVRSTGGRSNDRTQGQCRASGSRLEGGAHGPNADAKSDQQQRARLPAKASDYGLERFNRLLDRLDRGNFLIKTSFKKSYSLILMSARGGSGPTPGGGDPPAGGAKAAGGGNSSSVSNSSDSSTTGATSSGTSGRAASFKRLQQQQQGRGVAPMGGSLRGWHPRTRGILIKANSSTAIYQLASTGRPGSAMLEQESPTDVTAAPGSAKRSPTDERAIPVPGQPEVAPPGSTTPPTAPNGNSLTPSDRPTTPDGAKDHGNNESDEPCCRAEVFDNDSGSGSGGRTELNNRAPPHRHASPRKPTDNYENIRPAVEAVHRSRQRLASLDRTLAGSAGSYRKKSNAASTTTGSEWDDEREPKLSSSLPHTSSEYYWQSADSAVPTRFFQRQDYLQPALDFPPDRSPPLEEDRPRATGRRTHAKRRWLAGKGNKGKAHSNAPDDGKDTDTDQPPASFHLPALFGGTGHGGGKRPPQLKNINLHFPNKTSYQQQQQQQQQQPPQQELRAGIPGGYQQLALPPSTSRTERKYFSRAKSHFLRLGQKWRLLTVSGTSGKSRAGHPHQQQQHQHHQLVSSYNLDDLIKATHRYGQENESANLSQKIVYKSYKSELDLTKNLAYLDTFLNEHFDDPERARGERTLGRGAYARHKRAKSCSKALEPRLTVAAEPTTVDDPGATPRTANLIQLEDVWDGGRGQWLTTNTSSTSSSEYLRNNLKAGEIRVPAKATQMRDFFRLDGNDDDGEDDDEEEDDDDDGEEVNLDDDDDARMLLFDSLASPFSGGVVPVATACTGPPALVEHYGKNNATSSSLSSSDYASVYSSATSSGGNGAPAANANSGPKASQFKLLATPEEGDTAGRFEYSPQKKQPRLGVLQPASNNATNPFMTQSATETPSAAHRIYNNFLDDGAASGQHSALSVPGSPAEAHVEKNHRLRKTPYGSSTAGRHPLGASRVPQNPSNGRAHFRQVALDTDLTYQEDYLQHYHQNAARARSLQTAPVGANSSFPRHLRYRHRTPGAATPGCNGAEDLRNSAPANEHSDNDSDTSGRVKTLAGDDEVVTADELLLLVNAAIDIRRSNALPHGRSVGARTEKSARLAGNRRPTDGESATGGGSTALLAYPPAAGYDLEDVDAGGRRAFPGGNGPPAASKSGTALAGSYLGYGPHRVIVSQSRKERGEVVLEYEC
uniref:Uncharacterized protein n=1 Tax=Anopheles dirus TaxID=7168 RepID=A0A182NFY3_9DIPT